MNHTIGMYVWDGSEAYEKNQINVLWHNMQLSQPTLKKLTRYQAKLAQLFSEGVYDHMKALDLILYAVDFQRQLTPKVMKPSLYTAWNVTRAIVRDLEENFFKLPRSEIRRFWDMEQEEENRVFEKWWELHKNNLTSVTKGGYN